DTEAALAFLRAEGLSVIQSIAVLVDRDGLTLAQAKQTVHLSAAWADLRDRHDAFHDQLIAAITPAAVFTIADDVTVWAADGAIHIKTREPHGDPVEMTAEHALQLAALLTKMAADL
ncbi:MAG: hypothetical protein QM608_00995, partial [Caulobacter sp.]